MSVNRRQLLQALGPGMVALGGGCQRLSESHRPPYLEDVTVRSGADTDHEFDLTIRQDDAVLQATTIELGEGESLEQTDCEWSGRGPFVVTCALDGSQKETVRVDMSDDIQQGTGEYVHLTFTATVSGDLNWSGYLDDGGVRSCSGSPSD